MIALGLVLLTQVRTPTVGDTVWVTRRVAVPAGHSVRAANWELTGDVELLGRPRVTLRDGSADVSYPLVAWTAGRHTLGVPGPLLLAPDGAVDSLPVDSMTISVASVLPRGVPDTTLAPQPQAGLVHRQTVTWLPLAVLAAAAAMLLAPLYWWWRRRGPRSAGVSGPAPVAPPLSRWAESGEARVVLAAAAARLRHAIAAAVPEAHPALDTPALLDAIGRGGVAVPTDEVADTLAALDRARFASATPRDVVELHARATELAERIARAPVQP